MLLAISKRGNKYLRKVLIHERERAALCGRAAHSARPMGQGSARPRSSEYRRRGVRRQARPDHLGGAAARGPFFGIIRGGVTVVGLGSKL